MKKLAKIVVLSLLLSLAIPSFGTDYVDFAGFCEVWLCNVNSSHEYNFYKGDDVNGMGIVNFQDFALWLEHEFGGRADGIIYIEVYSVVPYVNRVIVYYTADTHWSGWTDVDFYLNGEEVPAAWLLGWNPVEPSQRVIRWQSFTPGETYTVQVAGSNCIHPRPWHYEYSNIVAVTIPE